MLEGRLLNVVEGLGVLLLVVAVFFAIALISKLVFHKPIGTKKYYTIAVFVGIIAHQGLSVFVNSSNQEASNRPPLQQQVSMGLTGLDAPFIAPDEAHLENFPKQLEDAILQLTPSDKEKVSESVGFLAFATAQHIVENSPEKAEQLSETDFMAKAYSKMYRYAQKNAQKMNLRKYVSLAESFKQKKPEWWKRYKESMSLNK